MAKEEAVEVAKATTVQVIETLCDKVGPVIKQVAESLGTSSEQIMVIFTKQALAESVANFITVFICVGIAFAWMKFSNSWFNKMETGKWDNEGFPPNIVVSCFMYSICVIVASTNAISGIKRFLNPEYYAFTEVLGKVTELIAK